MALLLEEWRRSAANVSFVRSTHSCESLLSSVSVDEGLTHPLVMGAGGAEFGGGTTGRTGGSSTAAAVPSSPAASSLAGDSASLPRAPSPEGSVSVVSMTPTRPSPRKGRSCCSVSSASGLPASSTRFEEVSLELPGSDDDSAASGAVAAAADEDDGSTVQPGNSSATGLRAS